MPRSRTAEIFSFIKRTAAGRAPGQLIIQISDRCNAFCPQCGMRVTEDFRRTSLPEDKIKKIIDDAVQRGISLLSFTGGEPLLDIELLVRLITHAQNAGIPYIRTGTNAFFLARPLQNGFEVRIRRIIDALAKTSLRNFWISIDSCDPVIHEEMRGFKDVAKGIEFSLPLFHEAGLYPAANMGINRNMAGRGSIPVFNDPASTFPFDFYKNLVFENAVTFYSFVRDLGFTTVNMCYPMSFDPNDLEIYEKKHLPLQPVYEAMSRDAVVRFTKQEKSALFAGISKAISVHRSKIRIFTPQSSLYALSKAMSDPGYESYPCRGGHDFFFASVLGEIFPCGYMGKKPLDISWGKKADAPHCFNCEWECFRDPSELFGPVHDFLHAPLRLAKRFIHDSDYFKLWINDIRYFTACDLFNGRVPPNYSKLAKF